MSHDALHSHILGISFIQMLVLMRYTNITPMKKRSYPVLVFKLLFGLLSLFITDEQNNRAHSF